MTRTTAPLPASADPAMAHPARRALAFRQAFLAGIGPEEVQQVAKALLAKAQAGDVAAARVLLDRCLGVQSVENWRTERRVITTEELEERFG